MLQRYIPRKPAKIGRLRCYSLILKALQRSVTLKRGDNHEKIFDILNCVSYVTNPYRVQEQDKNFA